MRRKVLLSKKCFGWQCPFCNRFFCVWWLQEQDDTAFSVKCRGMHVQLAHWNSWTRKVGQKVLQEHFLCTFWRWYIHLNTFSELTRAKPLFFDVFFFCCCNFDYFGKGVRGEANFWFWLTRVLARIGTDNFFADIICEQPFVVCLKDPPFTSQTEIYFQKNVYNLPS